MDQGMSLTKLSSLLLLFMLFGGCSAVFRIGSFNIQIFGQTKSGKPDVMATLVKIIHRYDILLIQEIRDSSGTAIRRLLDDVNGNSSEYRMVISDRLGRGHSKEQYAFFYRPESGVKVIDSYHYDDGDERLGDDTFEREPFIVRFFLPSTDIGELSIVGVHIRPDRAVQEIESMRDVYNDVKVKWEDNNVLMMGDFNAGCSYVTKTEMKSLTMRSDFYWLIGDDVDTTVAASTCAYDRFIVGGTLLESIVNGSAVPYRFDLDLQLTPEQTEDVSDHYPIELELKQFGVSGGGRTFKHGLFGVTCVLLIAIHLL